MWFHVIGVAVAASALAGCAEREVAVHGSTRTLAPLSGGVGPLSVLVADADALDRGDEEPILAVVRQGDRPGTFDVTVSPSGDALEALVVSDEDASGACSPGDKIARARIPIGEDAERAGFPELIPTAGEECPAYAKAPF